MSRHRKTTSLIETAAAILAERHPMTVRQVFYALVSRQVIENSRGAYQAVSKALVAARCEGLILWAGLPDFAETAAAAYRRNVWVDQLALLETWLEKDALSGIFADVLEPYGVTLNVGRGFDGWDSIHNAARPLGDGDTILYFGDFDPSGEDMVRSLRDRLASLGSRPDVPWHQRRGRQVHPDAVTFGPYLERQTLLE